MRNKTNVVYVKTKYVVNDKKVQCFLTYEIDLSKWPVFGFKINSDVILKAAKQLKMEYYRVDNETNYPTKIGFVSIASASCDNTDNFDEKKGKNIALTRAQAKAFERTCRLYDIIQMELDKSFNEITRIIDNNWHAANKCWDHAMDLGGF